MRAALIALLVASSGAFAESAAGIEWKAPDGWKLEPARPMRAATYRIPAANGDPEDAELGVFHFGQGQGGSIDANIQRWISQFEQPDGKPSQQVAKVTKEKNGKLETTVIDLPGTYLASVGGPMSPAKERKPKFRLLGAIVEAPEGSVFFKMTGPEKTVAAARPGFQKMLKSIKATGK